MNSVLRCWPEEIGELRRLGLNTLAHYCAEFWDQYRVNGSVFTIGSLIMGNRALARDI